MTTDPCDKTGAAQAVETPDEIIQTLARLARRSRREGLACASTALDQAMISVFNALFVDRQASAPAPCERPLHPQQRYH